MYYIHTYIQTYIHTYISLKYIRTKQRLIMYCKSFKVEKFCGFRRLIGKRKTFPVKQPVQ